MKNPLLLHNIVIDPAEILAVNRVPAGNTWLGHFAEAKIFLEGPSSVPIVDTVNLEDSISRLVNAITGVLEIIPTNLGAASGPDWRWALNMKKVRRITFDVDQGTDIGATVEFLSEAPMRIIAVEISDKADAALLRFFFKKRPAGSGG